MDDLHQIVARASDPDLTVTADVPVPDRVPVSRPAKLTLYRIAQEAALSCRIPLAGVPEPSAGTDDGASGGAAGRAVPGRAQA